MTVYTGPNTMASALLEVLEGLINEYVSNDATLAAAKGDRGAALKAWAKSSEDPEAVSLRNTIAEAQRRLLDMASENVPDVIFSESEVSKIEAEQGVLKTRIRAGFAQMPKTLIFDATDKEGVTAAMNSLSDPTKGRASAGGGSGHSGPRASAYVWLTNDQGLPVVPAKGQFDDARTDAFKSFSHAAKALQVPTAELTAAFAEAAGVEHDKLAEIDTPQEFTFSAKGGSAVFGVRTEHKPRANAK